MKVEILLALLLSVLCTHSSALKILGIFPFPSKSHYAIGNSIAESLLNAGHEVTVMTPYKKKTDNKNYHQIDVSKILEVMETGKPDINPFIFGQSPAVGTIFMLTKLNAEVVDLFMTNSEVQQFMKEDQKFDICIFERFLVDSLLGIAEKSGCILVDFLTFAAVRWVDDLTGNISPTSYVPNPFLEYTDKMSFKERMRNTAISLVENAIYYGYYKPMHRSLYAKYFPNAKRSFDEIYHDGSIIFIATHISSNTPRPVMPNVIEIGGIHVKKAKPLPSDIQNFLDSATEGAILFSMGSFIKSMNWPVEKRDAFTRAFGKLKQKVLWKYENETLPGNPGNIMIGSWIPQRDILAHPNVKLFITHGGGLGTTEAVAEGVPVLGIPIFGDQKLNMAKTIMRGYGLKVDYEEVTEENILSSIKEMLSNPKYKRNAVEVSDRFKDRPMTAEENVVFWTEYAARHNGASFLKGQSVQMSFIQLQSIDVYAVILAVLFIILYVKFKILKAIFRKCFGKSTPKKVKKS